MLNNFSPNMLKTYETCPKKFYFQYIEGLNVPKSLKPFEKGKKIHALANYYLRGTETSKLETSLTVSEMELWERLKQNSYYQKEYLKSEFSLSCRIDKYWIGGRIDAIVHEDDNYYILDYKTGSIPKNPEFDYQTMVYLLCLDKYLKNYNSLSFVYINLKENKDQVIEFSPKNRTQYQEKISSICEKISQDRVYRCNNQNCKYCEFSKICNI